MNKLLVSVLAVIVAAGLFVAYRNYEDQPEEISLKKGEREFPTAGACGDAIDGTGIFAIHNDIPGPRCIKFLVDEKIGFKNSTQNSIKFNFAGEEYSISPGETKILDKTPRKFLDFGVHKVPMDVYAGSGPEIWIVRNRENEEKIGFIRDIDLNKLEIRFLESGEDKNEITLPVASIAIASADNNVVEIKDFKWNKDAQYKIIMENGIVIMIEPRF